MSSGCKPYHYKLVEQLHLFEDRVLRTYQNCTDASEFMHVRRAGILLCCNGIGNVHCGFRWRYYRGPSIDFEALEQYQTPLEELKKQAIYPTIYIYI